MFYREYADNWVTITVKVDKGKVIAYWIKMLQEKLANLDKEI